MPKFEGVQAEILSSLAKNQLVSAGAGSGKTTIMIEKIANMILKEGVSIDNLLVVTFTVLAATEMKERLINKFKLELENCNEQDKTKVLSLIEQIKTASIDTIDGFSSKTIKKYFYELGIAPNIEIISDNTRDYYLSKAMKKTISDFQKQTDKVNLVLDLFSGNKRNFDSLEELILTNYYNVINLKDYEKFLLNAESNYVDSLTSEKTINEHIFNSAQILKSKIICCYDEFETEIKNRLNDFLVKLESFSKHINFVTNLNTLNNLVLPKFTTKEFSNNLGLKDLNDSIKDFYKIKIELEEHNINADFEEKNLKIREYLSIFIDLLKNFIKNYNTLKEKYNLIDFNDLNRLMLKLLNVDEIKFELQQKYKYIFIDEYQDVNPLQDELMSLLTGKDTTVFMVGDVKQSIYGFRGASPEWFLNKYKNFKSNNSLGSVFDMNVNFRSNPIILNFINEIFSKLMTQNTADIDYKSDAMIQPKREDIIDSKVKLMFISNKQEKEIPTGLYSVKENSEIKQNTVKNQEALLVLKIITELIGTEFYDANLKQNRILNYRDIAILSRSEKDDSAKELIELLKENNVPLNLTNKLDVNASETIKLILSILKCVANVADDVDYLAMFMSLTNLDINDIISIRDKQNSLFDDLINNLENPTIKAGFDVINDIKINSYVKTNTELIRYILNEKKLKYFILFKENGQKELNLIEEFLNKISIVEDSLSLCEFIEVIESSVNNGGDFSSQDNENSVTIQTIHKSKGLEYPVVILYNSSKMFSYIREHDGINFDSELGLGIDYFNLSERTKSYSLNKFAINLKNKEKGYKEELRLLYVALTRAKNKLFITGYYSPKMLSEGKFNKNSYGNMVLDCFANRIQGDYTELKNCEIYLYDEIGEADIKIIEEEKQFDFINKDFEYENSHKFEICFKNTVTGLNSKKSQLSKFNTSEWLKPRTQYDNEEDKALIGTHYHTALEKLDYCSGYRKNTDFKDVDYLKIEKAHKVLSELCVNSLKLHKEADFEMYVPYCELVQSDITDKVLVQGVVDLIIERENSIDIVDYKFSSLKLDVLKQKYAEQLILYKKAVEYAFKKPVKNTFIYSINTGELE